METPTTPTLDRDRLEKLKSLSQTSGRPMGELLGEAVDDFVDRSRIDIRRLAEQIAEDNAELYRRLAQ